MMRRVQVQDFIVKPAGLLITILLIVYICQIICGTYMIWLNIYQFLINVG